MQKNLKAVAAAVCLMSLLSDIPAQVSPGAYPERSSASRPAAVGSQARPVGAE